MNPIVDFVFKRIFGTEENKDLLLSFLAHQRESGGRQGIHPRCQGENEDRRTDQH
nr:PD-(D/E)XK nuclease family transposase [Brevibacillus invocatus]